MGIVTKAFNSSAVYTSAADLETIPCAKHAIYPHTRYDTLRLKNEESSPIVILGLGFDWITLQTHKHRDRDKERKRDRAMAEKEGFRVYNSMTQQKEIFNAHVPGRVGMYVCGVTAYDLSHIGHARAAVNFDVLYRFYFSHFRFHLIFSVQFAN